MPSYQNGGEGTAFQTVPDLLETFGGEETAKEPSSEECRPGDPSEAIDDKVTDHNPEVAYQCHDVEVGTTESHQYPCPDQGEVFREGEPHSACDQDGEDREVGEHTRKVKDSIEHGGKRVHPAGQCVKADLWGAGSLGGAWHQPGQNE